jgi:hypothetical protein
MVNELFTILDSTFAFDRAVLAASSRARALLATKRNVGVKMSSVINDIEESLADLLPTLENLTELCGTRLTVDPTTDGENTRPEAEIAREVLAEARSEAHDLLFALRRLAMTRALYPRTVTLRAALQRINRRISKSGLRVATARSASDKDAGRFMLIEGAFIRDGFENVDELSDYARHVGVLHESETIVDNAAKQDVPAASLPLPHGSASDHGSATGDQEPARTLH